MAMKAQLRAGLGSLPAPRNDFEIVIPEQEEEVPEKYRILIVGINCVCVWFVGFINQCWG